MKTQYQPQQQKQHLQIQREIVEVPKMVSGYECIYGKHPAELLHRGTAYCRKCYDERNPYGKIIDP